jgi:hypothetical protein
MPEFGMSALYGVAHRSIRVLLNFYHSVLTVIFFLLFVSLALVWVYMYCQNSEVAAMEQLLSALDCDNHPSAI